MTWRSKAVEETLSVADEVLVEGGIVPHLRGLNAVMFFPRLIRTAKNPDGAKLADVLPQTLYERFSVLKAKYAPNDGRIERLRPVFAAETLSASATGTAGLSSTGVIPQVVKLAKKHRRKITRVETDAGDVTALLTNVRQRPTTGCLETTIRVLEADLEVTKARANAWAVGDLETLRKMAEPADWDQFPAELFGAERWDELNAQHTDAWLSAVERALERNRTTFAALNMRQLLQPDGWLTTLRDMGLTVEEP